MRISLNWLKDFVDIESSDIETIVEGLTDRGIEVESIEKRSEGLENLIVAQITSKKKHPNADKLSLLELDTGSAKLLVVCGASNMSEMDKVVLATQGVSLPNGMLIKKTKIRGVESSGMCCSYSELGIDKDPEGIIILPAESKLGSSALDILGLDDTVVVLATPPNRGDVLGYLGIAREVCAIVSKNLKYSVKKIKPIDGDGGLKVDVQDERCIRYIGRLIKGLKVGPSPDWIVSRLDSAGIRPINNVVDITNYVMLETGQPLHAFDLSKLSSSKIIVRKAAKGEFITLLDETERKLTDKDMLICDENKALAIAGVMGGLGSGVDESTKDIVLECACFSPSSIRLSSKNHDLLTDSSYRFERGVDPELMQLAVDRASSLFRDICGAELLYEPVDIYKQKKKSQSISIDARELSEFLGLSVNKERIIELLSPIGFSFEDEGIDKVKVLVPSFRMDVSIKADIYEEVARLNGYDKIPAELPAVTISDDFDDGTYTHNLKNLARYTLKSLGYLETVNYSFVPESYSKLLSIDEKKLIRLKNPIVDTMKFMRTSLLTSLLESLRYNINHRNTDIKIFEIGKTYFRKQPSKEEAKVPKPQDSVFEEKQHLSAIVTGNLLDTPDWTQGLKQSSCDFYTVKGELVALLSELRLANFDFLTINESAPSYLHPGSSVGLRSCGVLCGYLGAVHPELLSEFDLSARDVFFFDLDLSLALKSAWAPIKSRQLQRFPSIRRDLSFTLKDEVPHASIMSSIRKLKLPNLTDYGVFDLYKGKGIPEGQKSVTYYFTFANDERTLQDSEVDGLMSKIIDGLKKEYLINIR